MKIRVLALIAWPIYIVVSGEAWAAPAEKIGSSTCRKVPVLAQRFVRDMRTKDIPDVLSLYAADAVFIQPDGSRVAGRAALEKLYRTVFATYDSELSPQDFKVEPEASGPGVCVQSGQFGETLRVRSPSSASMGAIASPTDALSRTNGSSRK